MSPAIPDRSLVRARRSFARHPRLGEARKAFIESMIDTFGQDTRLIALYMDLGRLMIFFALHVLHARQDPKDVDTLLTQGAVETLVVENGFASRGKVRAFLARLTDLGMLKYGPHPLDNRKKCIILEDILNQDDLRIWRPFLCPLIILDDDRRYDAILSGDLRELARVHSVSLPILPVFLDLLRRNPELRQLMSMDCALLILLLLVQQALQLGSDAPVIVPYSKLAQSVALSRTHVWKVVKLLEAMKLVSVDDASKTTIHVLPWAYVMLDRWLVFISALIKAKFDVLDSSL